MSEIIGPALGNCCSACAEPEPNEQQFVASMPADYVPHLPHAAAQTEEVGSVGAYEDAGDAQIPSAEKDVVHDRSDLTRQSSRDLQL